MAALGSNSSKPTPSIYIVFSLSLVNLNNRGGRFKFLETAKELPTIMTSDIDCITTTMKCIALGAVEFLRKPLSEEKLKNIWQHVVHKAFSAGGNTTSESIKTNNDSMVSLLQLQIENANAENQFLEGQDIVMESTHLNCLCMQICLLFGS